MPPIALAYLLVAALLLSTALGFWVVGRVRRNDETVKRWTRTTLNDLAALGDDAVLEGRQEDSGDHPRLRTDPKLMRVRPDDKGPPGRGQ